MLYVSDYGGNRIQVYNATNGQHIRVIGKGPGAVMTPRTAEMHPKWYENFDLNLHIRKSLEVEEVEPNEPGQVQGPSALCFVGPSDDNPLALLFVADSLNNRVQIFNADSGWLVQCIG